MEALARLRDEWVDFIVRVADSGFTIPMLQFILPNERARVDPKKAKLKWNGLSLNTM
jgi:hypothetical protein